MQLAKDLAKDRTIRHAAEDSMAGSTEKNLASIGVTLPTPRRPDCQLRAVRAQR